jgi:hypothetical protein
VLQGEGDGVVVATQADTQANFFTDRYQRRLIPVIGHDLPQEAPKETAAAVLELFWIATTEAMPVSIKYASSIVAAAPSLGPSP